MEFIEVLKERNTILFWFGLVNLITALVLMVFSVLKPLDFAGVNAWYKPTKFALSTTILVWSVAWYSGYLPASKGITWSSWIIVITLAFEVIYIAIQASRGQASHFNQSTPLHASLYGMMALAATIATLAVGYIGTQFFGNSVSHLPGYYLWAIRIGFILFVVFSFQGFLMGSRLAHTVGGPDGGAGIPFLNWSLTYGDLRIAHFVGMHALQLLPLLAWYVLKDIKITIGVGILYGFLGVLVLTQALRGNAIININS